MHEYSGSTATGINQELATLIAQAERGEPCPRVTLLTAAGLVQGIPASRSRALEARRAAVREALRTSGVKSLLNRRGPAPEELARPMLQYIDNCPPTPGHMHLVPAAVMPLQGAALNMPTMTVNLSHVVSWWLGLADVSPQRSPGSAVGFVVDF
ncbi:hypothetical protein [Calidifontibacter indicus]|uniref:hypothetical protein n=1 Tax=Calidifontibacter indicus TaxID=419650 RepID=UPI0011C02B1A|nr:hypothetical protein [Calidifontibacter indicus]